MNKSNVNHLNVKTTKKVNKIFKEKKEILNKSVGLYLQHDQLNKTDRAVLAYLSKSWAMDIGRYRSTLRKYSSMQKAVERSYHAVYRSIKKMQKLGILKVEHRKQCKNVNIQACNRYILIPHPSLKNENGQNQNANPKMQGRGSEKLNAQKTDTKPFASKLLLQLNPLPITLSLKNILYKSCIKKNETKNEQYKKNKTHNIKSLHLQINDLVDVVGFKQDKKIKRERMYLQYAAKMCKFLMQDAFDVQEFMSWIRSPFLKLFKPKKYRTYQTHNHLLTALVQDFVEQKIGGVGYRLRDWYNMQMQKKEEQNNKKPLTPAFTRKPLVFD